MTPTEEAQREVERLREALVVARNALVRLHEIGPLKSVKREQLAAIAKCNAILDESAAPDKTCAHGIRWPWQCDDCDAARLSTLKGASDDR